MGTLNFQKMRLKVEIDDDFEGRAIFILTFEFWLWLEIWRKSKFKFGLA